MAKRFYRSNPGSSHNFETKAEKRSEKKGSNHSDSDESYANYKGSNLGRMNDDGNYRGNERSSYRKNAMDGFYAGAEPRRRQELEDAGMIHEDHSAIANLPQNVMIKDYPTGGYYLPEGINDRLSGIDHQMDYDDNKRRQNFNPHKY